MTDKQRILVVAAHPDDEVLGCGGTMAWHAFQGDEVFCIILAEGLTSRDASRNRTEHASAIATLQNTAKAAAQVLGIQETTCYSFPDNRMDGVERLEVVKIVEAHIQELQPTIVYTHHAGDVNIDHQVTHHAVVTACRPQPGSMIQSLLFFEIPSSTEWQTAISAPPFVPQWFQNIQPEDKPDFLGIKCQALDVYQAEMRPWPHSRSIQAVQHLAHWRGASAGYPAAEAFALGRHRQ
ncbi:MAG: PIG-L family deacetylase [Cyanobacteria bacterium]|nr:PIG-L family deacetylase [Cyanobacteriota bacterium]